MGVAIYLFWHLSPLNTRPLFLVRFLIHAVALVFAHLAFLFYLILFPHPAFAFVAQEDCLLFALWQLPLGLVVLVLWLDLQL